jgi:hypothetical protein
MPVKCMKFVMEVPVGALRTGIFEIAKPLDLRRNVREALKLGRDLR